MPQKAYESVRRGERGSVKKRTYALPVFKNLYFRNNVENSFQFEKRTYTWGILSKRTRAYKGREGSNFNDFRAYVLFEWSRRELPRYSQILVKLVKVILL